MAIFTSAGCCGSSCVLVSTRAVQVLRPYIRFLGSRWTQAPGLPGRDVSCNYTRSAAAMGASCSTLCSCDSLSVSQAYYELAAKQTGRRRRRKLSSHTRLAAPHQHEGNLCQTNHAESKCSADRIPVKGVVANRTATYRKVALRVEWTGVKAYNASGTSGDKQYPSGKSWLRCLKEVFPEELHGVKCAVTGCPERAAVGAHVMVQSDPKDTCMRYPMIAGFCKTHNSQLRNPATKALELKIGAPLVPISINPCWNKRFFMMGKMKTVFNILMSMNAVQQIKALWNVARQGFTHGLAASEFQQSSFYTSAGNATSYTGLAQHQVVALGSVIKPTAAMVVDALPESPGMSWEATLLVAGLAVQLSYGPDAFSDAGFAFENGYEQAAACWREIFTMLITPRIVKKRSEKVAPDRQLQLQPVAA